MSRAVLLQAQAGAARALVGVESVLDWESERMGGVSAASLRDAAAELVVVVDRLRLLAGALCDEGAPS